MKRFAVLSIAALLAASLWPRVQAQVPALPPPAPPATVKTLPPDQAAAVARPAPGPPFAVVESKRSDITNDLATAAALGIRPVRITSPASIEGIAPRGQAFKWVLTRQGELWALPMLDRHLVFTEKDRDIIKHDIVTGEAPVDSAGKGQMRGDTLLIDPQSGHYHPSIESVKELAQPAFKAAGFARVEVCRNLLSD